MSQKYSKQREEIERVLNRKDYHPTVDEIYTKVRMKIPNISLATVYRNVAQLCKMGKIFAIKDGDGPVRYDGNPERHYHIKCLSCGKVKDVWLDKELNGLSNRTDLVVGFTVIDYQVSFTGVCEECASKHQHD